MRDTLWPAVVLAATLCTTAYAGDADFNAQGDATDTFASAAAVRRADLLVRKMTLDENFNSFIRNTKCQRCRAAAPATSRVCRASAFPT